MNKSPISYASIKCILQYMDPNLRLKCANQIPSIQSADNSTPFYIKSMKIGPSKLKINEIKYELTVIREYADKKKLVQNEDYESYGAPYDLNPSGKRDWTTEDIIAPGDVVIRAVDEVGSFEKEGRERTIHAAEMKVMELEDKLGEARMILRGLRDDDENVEIPVFPRDQYTDYIELRIWKKSTCQIHKERLLHNKTMPEATKYLTNKFFGGRRLSVNVKLLKIKNKGGILRMPETLKLKVQEFEIGHNAMSVLNGIGSLIDETSIPLKSISIDGLRISEESENYNHPWIHTTEFLLIQDEWNNLDWISTLLMLQCKSLHLECKDLPIPHFARLIDNWLQNGKEIGTKFSFGIDKRKDVARLMDSVMERSKAFYRNYRSFGCSTFPDTVVIPMNSTSRIVIYCDEELDDDSSSSDSEEDKDGSEKNRMDVDENDQSEQVQNRGAPEESRNSEESNMDVAIQSDGSEERNSHERDMDVAIQSDRSDSDSVSSSDWDSSDSDSSDSDSSDSDSFESYNDFARWVLTMEICHLWD